MPDAADLNVERAAGGVMVADQTALFLERLYPRLEEAAAGLLRNERAVSLAPGDLLHQAALDLLKLDRIVWQSEAHFRAMAAKLLRRALIDHARAKKANKRDHVQVTLVTGFHDDRRCDLDQLNHALLRLSAINPEAADIVEMRYFGGMSLADIATVTGLSEPTVKRRWAVTRGWLVDALATLQ